MKKIAMISEMEDDEWNEWLDEEVNSRDEKWDEEKKGEMKRWKKINNDKSDEEWDESDEWDKRSDEEMKKINNDKSRWRVRWKMMNEMKSEMKWGEEVNGRDEKWDEEWDEEMKNKFLVQTYINPNLVLSQILFTGGMGVVCHTNTCMHAHKHTHTYIHYSDQTNLKKKMVRICIKSNLLLSHWGGVLGPKIKVAQNDLKHILILDLLRSDEVFKIL